MPCTLRPILSLAALLPLALLAAGEPARVADEGGLVRRVAQLELELARRDADLVAERERIEALRAQLDALRARDMRYQDLADQATRIAVRFALALREPDPGSEVDRKFTALLHQRAAMGPEQRRAPEGLALVIALLRERHRIEDE